jgi:rhodanese-related sulfurtransferase
MHMTSASTPQISVEELDKKLKSADPFVLLDVREDWELSRARIVDNRFHALPMSRLGREGTVALPPAAKAPQTEILVLCHQGVRSATVADWLKSQGWTNVFSVSGGLEEYARRIDPSVGSY